jgi:hypothetical protein
VKIIPKDYNRLGITEINGKELRISELEYLYSYTNDNGEKIAVFEFEGDKIEKKIEE